jgi:hypothetical protein
MNSLVSILAEWPVMAISRHGDLTICVPRRGKSLLNFLEFSAQDNQRRQTPGPRSLVLLREGEGSLSSRKTPCFD